MSVRIIRKTKNIQALFDYLFSIVTDRKQKTLNPAVSTLTRSMNARSDFTAVRRLADAGQEAAAGGSAVCPDNPLTKSSPLTQKGGALDRRRLNLRSRYHGAPSKTKAQKEIATPPKTTESSPLRSVPVALKALPVLSMS